MPSIRPGAGVWNGSMAVALLVISLTRTGQGKGRFAMATYQTRLRALGLATIALTLLSAPTLSTAQTAQGKLTAQAAKTHWRKYASRQWRPNVGPNLYGSARSGCTWPYQNQFPPCMSTFPEGSPNYHGGRPGPTFDNE
jgi:hypothetical protein